MVAVNWVALLIIGEAGTTEKAATGLATDTESTVGAEFPQEFMATTEILREPWSAEKWIEILSRLFGPTIVSEFPMLHAYEKAPGTGAIEKTTAVSDGHTTPGP